jgi:hypothetical protein
MNRSLRKRRAATAGSALGVAAILLAGLPALTATAATPTSESDKLLPLVLSWPGVTPTIGGFAADSAGHLVGKPLPGGSFADAVGAADLLEITPNSTGQIRNAAGNRCLDLGPTWGSGGNWDVLLAGCTTDPQQRWSVDPEGFLINGLTETRISVAEDETGTATLTARFTNSGTPVRLTAEQGTGDGRFGVDVDVSERTVTISGQALPHSYVTVRGNIEGRDMALTSTTVGESGTWTSQFPASILEAFPDVVLYGQSVYLGQTQKIELNVDAQNVVAVDRLEGEIPAEAVVLKGSAQRDATVVVREGDTVLAQQTATPRTGASIQAAGDEGLFSIPLEGLSAGEHILTVEQAQLGAPTVTSRATVTVTVAPAENAEGALPFVLRWGTGDDLRHAGFHLTDDGHLVSTNAGKQTAEQAGVGALTLTVTRGGTVVITDPSGKTALTAPVADQRDQRVTMKDLDGSRAQEWFVAADGSISNSATRANLNVQFSDAETAWNLVATTGTSTAKFSAPAPAVSKPFVFDVALSGGDLTVAGQGTPGHRVDLTAQVGSRKEVLYAGDVKADGTWTATVKAAVLEANSSIPFVATQTLFGNDAARTIDVDAKNVVTIEGLNDGDTIDGSSVDLTGAAQKGEKVVVKEGDRILGETIAGAARLATNAAGDEGVYSIALEGLAAGEHTFTVEQAQNANVTTRTSVSVEVRPSSDLPFAVTSHADGSSYVDGVATFRGTGIAGARITAVNQWGTVMGTTSADASGNWAIARNLGPTTDGYDLTFTQTANGAASDVKIHLAYASTANLEITSPADGSRYKEGTATFIGTAKPGSAIRAANQWGTVMGTATANATGDWKFTRNLGPTAAGYDITVTATKGADVQTASVHLDFESAAVPVAITSVNEGDTYKPGLNILRGTGTPGATVAAVNATNGWNVAMGSAVVADNGVWELPARNWGPSNDYAIKVTQTNPDKTTSTATVNVKAPVFQALKVVTPTAGDTYENGVAARFSGTATPYATVTVRSAVTASTYVIVTADADGAWSFDRLWGPSHTYTLTFDQKALNGQKDSVTGFVWAPGTK